VSYRPEPLFGVVFGGREQGQRRLVVISHGLWDDSREAFEAGEAPRPARLHGADPPPTRQPDLKPAAVHARRAKAPRPNPTT